MEIAIYIINNYITMVTKKMEKYKDDLDKSGNKEINSQSQLKRSIPKSDRSPVLEHLLYGIGTGIITIVPLLIPGISSIEWVMALFGSVMFIYTIICLLGVWESINKPRHRQGAGRNRRR
jgi:hypothetical protein